MNRIEITGRLGGDPELRVVGNGVKASLRLAHNVLRQDGTKGNTTWIDVEAWDELAEEVAQTLAKANYVKVTGRLIQQTWDDKTTGAKRSKHVIRAREIILDPYKDEDKTEAQP
jgi:single-strand DNA-binding protein